MGTLHPHVVREPRKRLRDDGVDDTSEAARERSISRSRDVEEEGEVRSTRLAHKVLSSLFKPRNSPRANINNAKVNCLTR